MAEVDTTQLSQEHGAIRHDIAVESARLGNLVGTEACGINKHIGDARRENEKSFADTRYDVATRAGDIRREIAQEHCKTNDVVRQEGQENFGATKDARHDVLVKVDQTGDRLSDKVGSTTDQIRDKLWSLNRDIVDTKTQVQTGFVGVSKDTELSALKVQLDAAKNVTYLSDKIERDGEKTRALINDLKYHDLNRGLVERNAELVECESERRHWRYRADQNQFQGQWAQLQSQIQAFQSQLQETRQGMVNFGTMAGVGQSSTSNNVR